MGLNEFILSHQKIKGNYIHLNLKVMVVQYQS